MITENMALATMVAQKGHHIVVLSNFLIVMLSYYCILELSYLVLTYMLGFGVLLSSYHVIGLSSY